MIFESRAPVRIDFAGAWTDCAPFFVPFGGATLNAAINRYVTGRLTTGEHAESSEEGIDVSYATDIPAGSGLGTSATLNVVWLSLAKQARLNCRADKEAIAASAYDIEKVLGIIGGKQDQFASAVGGINLFEFKEEGDYTHPVNIAPSGAKTLQSLLVLCYTGKSRLSSNIHANVWDNFRAGRRETVDALFSLRDSAYEGRNMLQEERFDEFGALLTRQFENMKHLDRSTTNETVEGLFSLVVEESSGGKPCGAGGGGCLLFCCRDAALKPTVERKIRDAGFSVIDFAFEFDGLTVNITE